MRSPRNSPETRPESHQVGRQVRSRVATTLLPDKIRTGVHDLAPPVTPPGEGNARHTGSASPTRIDVQSITTCAVTPTSDVAGAYRKRPMPACVRFERSARGWHSREQCHHEADEFHGAAEQLGLVVGRLRGTPALLPGVRKAEFAPDAPASGRLPLVLRRSAPKLGRTRASRCRGGSSSRQLPRYPARLSRGSSSRRRHPSASASSSR